MTTQAGTMPERRRPVMPNSVLAMLIFISTEVMFFAGLISAFTITRAGAAPMAWSLPAGQMLPAGETAFNSLALILSGLVLVYAHRRFRDAGRSAASMPVLVATLLGALFVVLQGREWWGLLSQGVTLQSSTLGAFFYVIVGGHALHAIAAIVALAVAWLRMRKGTLTRTFFYGAEAFWYFVVAIWPLIYFRVYF
jgi:cytochrome c oxidase subunit 3